MKSPLEKANGRIVGYDEQRQELLIRVPYSDWHTLTKRQYKTCVVQLVDSRPVSSRQRRCCYALLGAISDETGMGKDPTKEYMKRKFLLEDLEALPLCSEHHTQAHSMSNQAFFNRYHLSGGIILDSSLCCIWDLQHRHRKEV